MNVIKRLVTSFSASFEDVVSSLENHEANLDEALRELDRTKVGLQAEARRVKSFQSKLTEQWQDAETKAETWRKRAAKLREENKERALECLKRARAEDSRRQSLVDEAARYDSLERRLGEDINKLEGLIVEARNRRSDLKVRAGKKRVMATLGPAGGLEGGIDEILTRWEMAIGSDDGSIAPPPDKLLQEFEATEEAESLMTELALLEKDR